MILGFILFSSCEKLEGTLPTEASKPSTIEAPTATPSQSINAGVPADATVIELGTGSGDLVIDGKTLKITSNAFIKIHDGTYSSITIQNVLATTAKPTYIKNNNGQVRVTGGMQTDNVSNIIIAGDNVNGLTYGFSFENIPFRAIKLNGLMTGVTIKSMSFKNVADYVIAGEKNNGDSFPYKGTAETRTDGFKVLNCFFENAGGICFGGNLNKTTGEDSGLFKDVEIANNTFQNSANVGTLCSFTNVQDYNIHNNVVNNVNSNNNNHNGLFFMQGNGKFHDNKLTNYQGNSIRMWLYSRGDSPVTCEIYNNICYNTRKYGAFELQAFDRNMYPGKSTYANAKVYNNTAGKMNTSNDFEGQILDLYNTGGSLEYYNNLGFDLNSKKSVGNMINNMSDTKITMQTNNIYKPNSGEAVVDLIKFISKFSGTGAAGQ
jgi:hypothetical protein